MDALSSASQYLRNLCFLTVALSASNAFFSSSVASSGSSDGNRRRFRSFGNSCELYLTPVTSPREPTAVLVLVFVLVFVLVLLAQRRAMVPSSCEGRSRVRPIR